MIIQDGIRRMYIDRESIFYYLTVRNEQYAMPAMPEGAREGILKGSVSFPCRVEAERAASRAAVRQRRDPAGGRSRRRRSSNRKYDVGADVWSVTSYSELYRDGNSCERWNMLHPARRPACRT